MPVTLTLTPATIVDFSTTTAHQGSTTALPLIFGRTSVTIFGPSTSLLVPRTPITLTLTPNT